MDMPERYYEQKHFIEDISLYFEQMGIPRMAGRILGVLLIANPPEQSIDDLCERLQASKSAISTNARLLSEMGLIERVPSPKPRRIYFRFLPGGWVTFMRMYLRMMASLHQIAERGLELLKDEDPALRERLQEAHDMFSLIEDELPGLLKRIEEQRGISR
ncbi:MAG TPA: MarR family transcriptional regulator [Candidatus Saccharicenans sp.]|jgi:DNA-binding transcriptional regulator GbsR (MarR family)|nr:MarR family transcriptional regulator [Candidatus Saccharicenans sp.]